jgi:fatty acid/phospholipid biosynthesis enzyme
MTATLMTAEGVFNFLFKKLKSQNSNLSKELLASLKRRSNERVNKDVMTLMAYL